MVAIAVIAPILAAISVALLALFSSLRKLTLEQITNTWKGIAKILDRLPGARSRPHQLHEPGGTRRHPRLVDHRQESL